jgi:magnesium-transporting ATPase (P-type)
MTIVLNTVAVSKVFQPEFSGLFFEVLGNFKTWIVILLGSVLALIPDFIYNSSQVLYFPNPAQNVRLHTKKGNNINE